MITKIIHKSETRGYFDYGWLKTHHTFSFSNYYNPERIHFGMLRVLNDDQIFPKTGFETHPHDNMEIISVPISGMLEHTDSMNNKVRITKNMIQVTSAGTGIYHSEMNPSKDEIAEFLQIWIFTRERNIKPHYDQKSFLPENRINRFDLLVSQNTDNQSLYIHQNAFISIAEIQQGKCIDYKLNSENNGVYFFIISGKVSIDNELLSNRDGIGIQGVEQNITVQSIADSEVLAIEVPMR